MAEMRSVPETAGAVKLWVDVGMDFPVSVTQAV
jgi:hypothetical protein